MADAGHAANERDQVVVARQHEGVDEDAGTTARRHLSKSLAQHIRVKAKRVFVNAAVGQADR